MTSVTYYAEEVQLPRGERVCALTSSTGRRLGVVRDKTTRSNNNDNDSLDESDGRVRHGANASSSGNNKNNKTAATTTSVRRATTAPTLYTSALSCVDMYGFRVTLREKAAEDAQRRRAWAGEQRRLTRWRALLLRWRATRAQMAVRKQLCRDGIPPALRATAWQWLLGTLNVASGGGAREAVYAQLCAASPEGDLAAVIDRDLARTFPTHRLFDGGDSVGQAMLRRVLRAYAVRNVEVGYVQGMSFLAATLLVQLESELDAFWALCALMEHPPYQLQRLYLPGFPQLHCACYVLERLLRRMHPALYARLRRAEVATSVYATQWFLTLFAYNVSYALLARVWDMFLCEGWKPVYRVALAFLVRGARQVLALRNDGDCILAVRALQDEQDMAAVLRTAQEMEFTTAQMQHHERRYWKKQMAELQQQQQPLMKLPHTRA